MTTEIALRGESTGAVRPERLTAWWRHRRTEAAIDAIYEEGERIKRREVAEAVGKLEADAALEDTQRETVEAMADAIVDRLLAVPARQLREAADDESAVETALFLFGPKEGADGRSRANGTGSPEGRHAR